MAKNDSNKPDEAEENEKIEAATEAPSPGNPLDGPGFHVVKDGQLLATYETKEAAELAIAGTFGGEATLAG